MGQLCADARCRIWMATTDLLDALMKTISKTVIRPNLWKTSRRKGTVRGWEIMHEYTDGSLSVTGEFKTYEDAVEHLTKNEVNL